MKVVGFFRFTVGNSWSDTQSLYVVLLNSIQKSYDFNTGEVMPHVSTSFTQHSTQKEGYA